MKEKVHLVRSTVYRAGHDLADLLHTAASTHETRHGISLKLGRSEQDYIRRSIQSLVAFLPVVPGFSCSGSRNPPEVKLPLIT